MTFPYEIIERGIYAFVDQDKIVYVGSSACGLEKLEYNHRNAENIPNYTMTTFRKQLATTYKDKGSFKWLVEPYPCDQPTIEAVEKIYIGVHNPLCNKDKDPVKSSRRYGRY